MSRAEMSALPLPSAEARPTNAGAPPPKTHGAAGQWASIEALGDADLLRWYAQIRTDAAMVSHLAAANPGLYGRVSRLAERNV
jgi:hypothetical protein